MHSVSVAFQTDKPLAAYGPLAATVENYGFQGVTVYNDMFFQPAWLPLLEMARQTRHVRLGPAAVNPFTCHPINIAANIALIDEASEGRAYLGLARGGWLDFLNLEPARPVVALREALDCIRQLLSGSKEPYPGQVFSLAGGETFRWPIRRADLPFLLGSWGPKTIRACIRHVSEVKIGGSANPGLVPNIQAVLTSVIGEAGRSPTEIGLVFGAVTVVDLDSQAAKALARREAALYLSIIADLDPTLDIEPELKERIKSASARYDFEQVATYISDDLLRRLAFAGAPEEVAAQAIALFEAGVQRVELGTPHGLTPQEGLRLLGERVLPALREYLEHN
jgi:5,10-methylenetetrahydromethanopterin reductase